MTGRPLDGWFRDGLALNPHGPALRILDRSWTYTEVDRMARSWAAALSARHRPRSVAVLAAKTPEAYIGLLAALYAGATAVPLNPENPPARNGAVLRAAGCEAVVADPAGAAGLAEVIAGAPVHSVLAPRVATDLPGTILALRVTADDAAADGFVTPPRAPDDIAYTLFTSGSTGTPKGVPISHANVSSFLQSALPRYGVRTDDCFSQVHETTFDLALADIFPAWAGGACVCVLSRLQALDPARWVRRYGLTVWHSTPSLARGLQRKGMLAPGSLAGLRQSVFAGEALMTDTARYWQRAAPDGVIDNIYGPTELTIACTAFRWDPAVPDAEYGATVPIGTPNDGMEALLLGADGETTPRLGELCLTGGQMFAGYLDPAEDAGRFLERGGQRWYRTGDQVRADDGVGFIHLGRGDSQVKINGYRVEVGEVEAALREVSGTDAATFAVEAPSGAVLAAYVLGDAEPDLKALVERLATRLPAYMLPRYVWWRPEAPLNAHGKTDRNLLREEAAREVADRAQF